MSTPTPDKRTCMFCDGRGMTGEHLWPLWMSRLEVRNYDKNSHSQWLSDINEEGTFIIKQQARLGSIEDIVIKRVCSTCNNGWMSAIQGKAKPLIINLLAGKRDGLTSDSQLVLAQWATMLMMVAEFLAKDRVAISPAQRRDFMETQRPPENVKLWIGNLAAGGQHHLEIYHSALAKITPDKPFSRDHTIQSTTLGLDGLFFYGISSQENVPIAKLDDSSIMYFSDLKPNTHWWPLVLQLWPPQHEVLPTPERPITDAEFKQLAKMISEISRTPSPGATVFVGDDQAKGANTP
ncbi:hypothetical protein ABID59_005464 [Bradyrhizobium sp. S3.3.6]|uniref:hypothetical protein n=1 Tax=Bradyrhizobium sp. S3.3.6 TaxID=3156429 RepID=UPI003399F956